MAAISLLGTQTFDTTAGTHTVVATPAGNDLIFIVAASGTYTGGTAPTDNNSDGLGTYTIVNTALRRTSGDALELWVRNSLIASATSTTFTHAPGAGTTGGGLGVIKITGAIKVGSSSVVQSAVESNITSGTPAPVLAAVPKPTNFIIGAYHADNNPTAMTQRTGYTQLFDVGYNTPASGVTVMVRAGGETSATITWGAVTGGSSFGDLAAEIAVPAPMINNYQFVRDAAGGDTGILSFTERIR